MCIRDRCTIASDFVGAELGVNDSAAASAELCTIYSTTAATTGRASFEAAADGKIPSDLFLHTPAERRPTTLPELFVEEDSNDDGMLDNRDYGNMIQSTASESDQRSSNTIGAGLAVYALCDDGASLNVPSPYSKDATMPDKSLISFNGGKAIGGMLPSIPLHIPADERQTALVVPFTEGSNDAMNDTRSYETTIHSIAVESI